MLFSKQPAAYTPVRVAINLATELDAFLFVDLVTVLSEYEAATEFGLNINLLQHLFHPFAANTNRVCTTIFGCVTNNTPSSAAIVKIDDNTSLASVDMAFKPTRVEFTVNTADYAKAFIQLLSTLTKPDHSFVRHIVKSIASDDSVYWGHDRIVIESMVSNLVKQWILPHTSLVDVAAELGVK